MSSIDRRRQDAVSRSTHAAREPMEDNMSQTDDFPRPDETDEIPNPETGVGIGADSEPDTFEPEEDPDTGS